MITRTFKLKIVAVVGLTLVACILVKIFWPAETVQVVQPEEKKTQIVKQEKSSPEAEKLYKMATLQKERPIPSQGTDYRMMIACCQRILQEYPQSPQAESAKELMQEIPQEYKMAYNEEMSQFSPSEPKVKKSRPLRRRIRINRRRGIDLTGEEILTPG
jgi:hypothetical protein